MAAGAPPARRQAAVLVAAAALAGGLLAVTAGEGWRMATLFVLGILLGLTLYLTAFGFSSAYRNLLVRGETAAVRAQLLMLATATLMFAPVLSSGSFFGRDVVGALAPVGLQVAMGAFMFGVGMQLAGGCGSGTLYTAGGGNPRMLIVLAAFCAGSFWASLHMDWWQRLPAWGELALGDLIGWPAAVTLQLAIFAGLWKLLAKVPRRGSVAVPGSAAAQARPWLLGAALLAVLNFLVLVIAGHPWSITWAFALWGAKAAIVLGWDPATAPFWDGGFQRQALQGSVMHDVTSVMDIGIMLGALAAAGWSGRFALRLNMPLRSLAAAVIGGVAMGYGARIAYGCNIGAFFSGVASTSLHGWLWIAAALAGCWVGIRLRPRFGMEN
ncbi:MAG: YeeE/YedE family protein [Burkholderiales bacterium]|nr:YeeE/YedE family protein [Burkholderiales bacterium]